MDRINPGEVGTPGTPDPLTAQEIEQEDKLSAMAKSPAYRSIFVVEREITLLRAEKERLGEAAEDLRARHDSLAPNYARLRQAFWDLKVSLGLGTLALTIGGLLVSVAGALTDPTVKAPLLWSGIGIGSVGVLISLWPLVWIRDREH